MDACNNIVLSHLKYSSYLELWQSDNRAPGKVGFFLDNSEIISLFLNVNIRCGPSLELSHWNASNDGSQCMFLLSYMENFPLIYPVTLSYLEHCWTKYVFFILWLELRTICKRTFLCGQVRYIKLSWTGKNLISLLNIYANWSDFKNVTFKSSLHMMDQSAQIHFTIISTFFLHKRFHWTCHKIFSLS